MLEDYQAGKSFRRARLGVTVVYVAGWTWRKRSSCRAKAACWVQDVANGSAAASAGVRPARQLVLIGNARVGVGGDFIVAVDGQPVRREGRLQSRPSAASAPATSWSCTSTATAVRRS